MPLPPVPMPAHPSRELPMRPAEWSHFHCRGRGGSDFVIMLRGGGSHKQIKQRFKKVVANRSWMIVINSPKFRHGFAKQMIFLWTANIGMINVLMSGLNQTRGCMLLNIVMFLFGSQL
jgi:hypothetical protein